MKTLDFTNEGTNVSSLLFNKAVHGVGVEPSRVLLHPEKDYSFSLSKGIFREYNIIFNEFEGGLYLGDNEHPFRYLVKPVDEDVDTLIVHTQCHLICKSAFENHPSLRRVAINAEDNIDIAENAFSHCPKLEDVRFFCQKSVLIRYEVFQKNPNLKKVLFDAAQYSFGASAFADCPILTHLVLPINLVPHPKLIHPKNVFKGTPLDHVYLPKTMKEVYDWFEKQTIVYCEADPNLIATSYKEETVEEPYYDYYHQGGTTTVRSDIRGGENFFGPISYEEYRKRFPKD